MGVVGPLHFGTHASADTSASSNPTCHPARAQPADRSERSLSGRHCGWRQCCLRRRDLELLAHSEWDMFAPWRRPLVDGEPRSRRPRRPLSGHAAKDLYSSDCSQTWSGRCPTPRQKGFAIRFPQASEAPGPAVLDRALRLPHDYLRRAGGPRGRPCFLAKRWSLPSGKGQPRRSCDRGHVEPPRGRGTREGGRRIRARSRWQRRTSSVRRPNPSPSMTIPRRATHTWSDPRQRCFRRPCPTVAQDAILDRGLQGVVDLELRRFAECGSRLDDELAPTDAGDDHSLPTQRPRRSSIARPNVPAIRGIESLARSELGGC
jgi:hypothetical protein